MRTPRNSGAQLGAQFLQRRRPPLDYRYLTDRILGQDEAPPSAEANGEGTAESTLGTIMEWFTGDSRQIDADEADRMFHEDVGLLQGSETVEMAFKAARDTILFTTKRLVVIDVKGLTGSQIEYKSIPWGCVQAFALQVTGCHRHQHHHRHHLHLLLTTHSSRCRAPPRSSTSTPSSSCGPTSTTRTSGWRRRPRTPTTSRR